MEYHSALAPRPQPASPPTHLRLFVNSAQLLQQPCGPPGLVKHPQQLLVRPRHEPAPAQAGDTVDIVAVDLRPRKLVPAATAPRLGPLCIQPCCLVQSRRQQVPPIPPPGTAHNLLDMATDAHALEPPILGRTVIPHTPGPSLPERRDRITVRRPEPRPQTADGSSRRARPLNIADLTEPRGSQPDPGLALRRPDRERGVSRRRQELQGVVAGARRPPGSCIDPVFVSHQQRLEGCRPRLPGMRAQLVRFVGQPRREPVCLGLVARGGGRELLAGVDTPEPDVLVLGGAGEDQVGGSGARGVFGREGEGADPVLVSGEGGLWGERRCGGAGDVYGDRRCGPSDGEDERRLLGIGSRREHGEREGEGVELWRGREGLEMRDLHRGGDAVDGDGPVGGGRGEDARLPGARRDRIDRPRPRALGTNPDGCEFGRAGGPRPGADALVDGPAEQDPGARGLSG